MKYCPNCGKPVHQTNNKHIVVSGAGVETTECTYRCESDLHKWILVIDPYGGPCVIKEDV
jgi:hypothetical protein